MTTEIIKHGEITEWKWASDNEFVKVKRFTSAYILDGLLIDTTAPGGVDDFRNYLKEIDAKNTIKKCIVTHDHEDHTGACFILEREFDIPVFGHPLAVSKMKNEKTYPHYRIVYWGEKRIPAKIHPLQLDEKITSKTGKYNFDIVELPGHDYDLIGLVDSGNEIIFVADAVMPKYQMIFGGDCDFIEDIKDIYFSIKKIYEIAEKIGDPRIFVSHYTLVNKDFLKERMNEIEELHQRSHKLYEKLLAQGISKERRILRKIVKALFGGEYSLADFTQGHLSRSNLVKSLLHWKL